MLETMDEYDGAGLAAPQVHVSRRIVIYGVHQNPRYPDAEDVPLTVLVNPKITPATSRDRTRTGKAVSACPTCAGSVPRSHEGEASRRTVATASRCASRPTASTPASCSTSAITWTARSTSIACARSRRSSFLPEFHEVRAARRRRRRRLTRPKTDPPGAPRRKDAGVEKMTLESPARAVRDRRRPHRRVAWPLLHRACARAILPVHVPRRAARRARQDGRPRATARSRSRWPATSRRPAPPGSSACRSCSS